MMNRIAERGEWVPQATRRGPCRKSSTMDCEYTTEEITFMKAMDQYKRDNHRPFPTASDILAVIHALGYRK